MIKKILVLGSLPKTEEEIEKYNLIIKISKEFAETVKSPIDTAKFKGSDIERYERAFQTIKDADLIIGEQSQASTGQGMEIREAAILNKKLIVVAKKGSKISGLVRGCPITKEIIFYSNNEDLESQLKETIKNQINN